MTESRESVRRRQFRDLAIVVGETSVPLAALCIIDGCLRLRAGANLCPMHQNETDPD